MQGPRPVVTSVISVVLGIATLLGTATIFVPDLRSWMSYNSLVAWAVSLVLLVALCVVLALWDGLKAQIKVLQARLMEPTARDLDQFSRILDWLTWDRGTMMWLEQGVVSTWPTAVSDQLMEIEINWREWFFDVHPVQEAFDALRGSVGDMTAWMALHAKADDPASGRDSIPRPSEQLGGWQAHAEIRQEGERLAQRLVSARRDFERIGRAHRL